MYSALEVANICGVANQTAINWIRNGYLQAFNTPGGQYRVYADDLVHFMTERKMRIPESLLSECSSFETKRILIVEDDVGLNTVLKQYFEKELQNIEIIQAFDGFEAGALISSKQPHIIILDLNLPGVNGIDLCKKIKNDESFGNPAIIVVTALNDSETEQKINSLGISNFFRKPVILSELVQAIRLFFSPPPLTYIRLLTSTN
ncbi:MAG: response regulator [Spirochaetaceae bacterium]|nr:response regulator [Spirochaetaceae bacterium]